MEKFIIENSLSLQGEVQISGAKNSVLKLLAASLLADGQCEIQDVPDLNDVDVMIEVLEELGSRVEYDKENKIITTEVVDQTKVHAPYKLTNRMRASIAVLGPLIAKRKRAKVALPGGCLIGSRPIDLHIKGFRAMGVDILMEHGYVEAEVNQPIKNTHIYLDFPSVGATENIIMAAVLGDGKIVLENAAQEPEITDLVSFLTKMGAKISGAGTSTIRITGVDELIGVSHKVIPDRIEAGTYMVAAAITGGDVLVNNILPSHLRPMISKLKEAGVSLEQYEESIRVVSQGVKNVNLTTLPYPGFPTDMQSQFMAMLTIAEGASIIKETIFENRFMHVNELRRMGANITLEGSSAIIHGVKQLEGASVRATDLRAGAALILAGFVASGTTEVYDIYHIDRGYVDIERKLGNLGASIRRVESNEQ